MKIEKAQMTLGEDTLRITMPLQKVDKQRRIVSGFATLNNVDKHGDVITKEASAKAFSEFIGNVRLMHQPIPAGKVLSFREEQYFDPKTESGFRFDDPDVGIEWPEMELLYSERDRTAPRLAEIAASLPF